MVTAAGMNQCALPQLGHQEILKLLSAALDKPLLSTFIWETNFFLESFNKPVERWSRHKWDL